jgi:hypothetical protein
MAAVDVLHAINSGEDADQETIFEAFCARDYRNHLANYLGPRAWHLESYSDEELRQQWTSRIRLAWRDPSSLIPDLNRDCGTELDLRGIEPPLDEVSDVFDAAIRKMTATTRGRLLRHEDEFQPGGHQDPCREPCRTQGGGGAT